MRTIDLLLAHFGGNPMIPFESAASYLQYKPDTLKQKIDKGEIRIHYFTVEEGSPNARESQKAPKFLPLMEIAALIDRRAAAAKQRFESVWEEVDRL